MHFRLPWPPYRFVLAAFLTLLAALPVAVRGQIQAPLAGGGGSDIVVTPDGGTASVPTGATGQTVVFTVKNVGLSVLSESFACASTGTITCTGLSLGSYSFDPDDQISVTATFSTGTGGPGTLTLSASGDASDQGWYNITVTGPALPIISLAPHNASNRDVSRCVATCFDGTYAHSTPAYYSLGQARGITLIYNSQTHKPAPVILADVSLPAGGTTPTTYSVQVRRPGAGPWLALLNGATIAYFTPHASGTTRLAVAFDAATHQMDSTDIVPLEMQVMANYSGSSLGTTTTVNVLTHSRRRSLFGAGVGLAGYQRLYRTTAGDILVTDGDGSVAVYDSTAAGYLRPAGAPGIRLEIKPGNPAASRYVRTYLDGTSLEFSDKGFLTRAVDRFGNATVFGYHAAPLDTLLATITDPMGKVLQLCYNAGCTAVAAKLQKVKILPGASERVVSYAYAGDTLVQIQDPDGYTQTLGYGANGLLASITDRAGAVTRLFYDGMRKLDSIRAPSVTLFDGTSGQPKVTYTPAERTAWRPDVSGSTSNAPKPGAPADTALKSTIADPAGAITRYSQDRFGSPTKVTDPFNNSTLLTRDSDGRVTRIDESNGHYATFSYNAQGQLTYSADGPGGTSTTLHYVDTLHLDVSYVEGDLVRTDYHYYGAGDPGGPAGALKDVYVGVTAAWPATGGGQLVTTYKADPLGRDTAAIDPLGHTTRYFYDPTWGHSLRVRDPSGIESRVTYDAAGRPDSSFSPLTLFTKTYYGPMNQVLSQWVGATGYHYGYTYDPATLQLTRVETPRRLGGAGPIVHKFSYNALGSLIARHDAADTTKADTLKYDLAGNLRKVRTRRGDMIDMSYDKAGRLLSRAGPGMPADSFAFDTVAGRWSVAWNSVARDSVHLDSRGRLDFWRQTVNGRTYSGTITYDAQDRPVRRVVKPSSPAADSSVVEFVYATTTGVRDSLCVFANPRRCVTFKSRSDFTVDTLVFNRGTANAWRLLQAQDASHRITSQTFTGGTNLAALELPILTYDSLSRNRTRTSPKGGSYTRRLFNYDLFGRLTQACDSLQGGQCLNVVDGTTAAAWSYDSAGNRDQIGITETYGDGNRLTAFGTTNVSYDAIGGVVCRIVGTCPAGTGVGYKYSWDALGRLRGIRNGSTGALVDSMFYDALGRRVRKQMAAADEYYVYEGDQVIFDLNASGTVLREYAWYPGAVDRLLALRATTPVVDTLAAILDPINGTVRGLARFRTGAKVKEFTEAPWGDAVADTGIVVRYRFAGREYDSESGLYYMRARYYDPTLGRWISEDPIGIAGGMNVYAYAGNDPVNGRDPSGLDPRCDLRKPPGTPGGCPLPMDTLEVFGDTGQNKGACDSGWILSTDPWYRLRCGGEIPDAWKDNPPWNPYRSTGAGGAPPIVIATGRKNAWKGCAVGSIEYVAVIDVPPPSQRGVFSVQRVAINDYFKIGPLRVKVLGGVGVYRGTYFGPVGPQALLMSLRAQAFVHCASGHAVFEGYAPTP